MTISTNPKNKTKRTREVTGKLFEELDKDINHNHFEVTCLPNITGVPIVKVKTKWKA